MVNNKRKYHDFYEPDIRLLFVEQVLNEGWNHNQLSAPFWRLYWNEEPGSFIFFKNQQIELTPDKIIVIPPNTPLLTRTVRPVQHFYVHFVIKPPYSSMKDKIFTFSADSEILSTIKSCIELLRTQRNDSFNMVFLCQKLICSIMIQLPEKELKNPYADYKGA
ncbi:MAG: hypothetical protein KOO69_06850 [Victivallales bacterium]|nr:hypothetical protein [Victivallales bacterium]